MSRFVQTVGWIAVILGVALALAGLLLGALWVWHQALERYAKARHLRRMWQYFLLAVKRDGVADARAPSHVEVAAYDARDDARARLQVARKALARLRDAGTLDLEAMGVVLRGIEAIDDIDPPEDP
jgi:hypothetical protein